MIGFALVCDGTVVWVSGDTVLYDGVRSVAGRWEIDVALIHLGGVQFPVTGPSRYTMTGSDAVELVRLIKPKIAVPIHYEGWKHFRQGRDGIEQALAAAPTETRERFRWVEIGTPTEL